MTAIVNDVKYYFLFLHKRYSSASSVKGSSTKVSNEASCVLTMTARRIHLGHFTQLGPARKCVTTSCFFGLMIWMFDFKMATCVLNLGLFHLKTVTLPFQHRAKLCVIHVL